jgi:hypothetical protein
LLKQECDLPPHAYDLTLIIYKNTDQTVAEKKSVLAELLSVDLTTLNSWLSQPGEVVAVRGVPLQIAENYASVAQDCDLETLITPSNTSAFELMPLEEVESKRVWTCPKCGQKTTLTENKDPDRCPSCDVDPVVWRAEQAALEERKKIRDRLKREHAQQLEKEKQRKLSEAEVKKKALLESQIRRQMGLSDSELESESTVSINVSNTKTLGLIGLTAFIVGTFVGYVSWEFTGTKEPATGVNITDSPKSINSLDVERSLPGPSISLPANQINTHSAQRSAAIISGKHDLLREIQKRAGELRPPEIGAANIFAASTGSLNELSNNPNFPTDVSITTSFGGLPDDSELFLEKSRRHHSTIQAVLNHSEISASTNLDPEANTPTFPKESLSDKEWDNTLLRAHNKYLSRGRFSEAAELRSAMRGAPQRVEAHFEELVTRHSSLTPAEFAQASADIQKRIAQETEQIPSVIDKIGVISKGTKTLVRAGVPDARLQSIEHLQSVAKDITSPIALSQVHAELGLQQRKLSDPIAAQSAWNKAEQSISVADHQLDRIVAYARLSDSFFAADDPLVASEILSKSQSEALLLTAPIERMTALSEIAVTKALQGNTMGSEAILDAIPSKVMREEVRARIGSRLAKNGRPYLAMEVATAVEDPEMRAMLLADILAELDLTQSETVANLAFEDLVEASQAIPANQTRAVYLAMTSKYGERLEKYGAADSLFDDAVALANSLVGETGDVTKSLLLLEGARAFRFEDAYLLTEQLKDTASKEILRAYVEELEKLSTQHELRQSKEAPR